MQELDLAVKALNDVVDNDVPFSEALRKIFQKNVDLRPLRGNVAGLLGCELRHHLLFRFLTDPLPDYSEEEKRYASIGLSNAYFFRHLDNKAVEAGLKERLGEEKFASLLPLLEKANKPQEYVPAEFSKSGERYLSLRYNTPEWVLKIWRHFGAGTTYRILKKNAKPSMTSVRVRGSMLNEETLLNNNPDFAKTKVPGILYYGGKIPLRKLPEFQTGAIFKERMAYKKILDELPLEEPMEALLYCGQKDSSLIKEVVERSEKKIGINIGVPNVDDYADAYKMIRTGNYKNINFFAAAPDSMKARISKKQDLVIAAPDSTNFDAIPDEPDYLLHFKKDGMDALFQQEEAVLLGVSEYVEEKGHLVYFVPTISMKEGPQLIHRFLENHIEFQLVKEEQLFPFEAYETALYYAILQKREPVATLGVPLGELNAADAQNHAASYAAKGE